MSWQEIERRPESGLTALSPIVISTLADEWRAYGSDLLQVKEQPPRRHAEVPRIDVRATTWRNLPASQKSAVGSLRAIVLSKALQMDFPVDDIAVDIESDPDEGTREVVLRVYSPSTAVQALAFWDSLGKEMDSWLTQLRGPAKRSALANVGLRFHWDAAG